MPCRNEEKVIENILICMKKQTYLNIEVIVVAHNCTDKTYAIAKRTMENLRISGQCYELKTKEVGKGLGLQYGLERAKGDLIVYFDTDNDVPPCTIKRLVNWIDRGYDGVQGKILTKNPRRNTLTWIQHIEFLIYPKIYCGGKHRLNMNSGIGGTGVMVTREALIKVGGFHNVLVEDFDLVIRLTIDEFKIAYAEDTEVYDEKVPYFKALLRQRARWMAGQLQMWKDYSTIQKIKLLKHPIDWLYFFNPICMFALLGSFIISAISFILSINIYTVPWTIWISEAVMLNLMFSAILHQQQKDINLRQKLYLPYALFVFSAHWYLVIIRSFFIHGWNDTKTQHGF